MLELLLAVTQAVSPQCRVEDAVYELRTDPASTARFHAADTGPDWPAGVVMELHVGASGRTYWWLPWGGGTGGRSYLASTTDASAPDWSPPWVDDSAARPLGDVRYFAFDADYRFLEGYPQRGGLAPAHVFIPDLGEALWYGNPGGDRDSAATQFFDLTGCDDHAAAED